MIVCTRWPISEIVVDGSLFNLALCPPIAAATTLLLSPQKSGEVARSTLKLFVNVFSRVQATQQRISAPSDISTRRIIGSYK